jgi:NADH-quinone oxidoreductase subunit G
MSADKFTIEVNGVELEATPGQMLIHVTDAAGIYIPRFCYHKNLSVAANCRMCLVEVEKAPKPLPACATPVTNGMKAFTKSHKAIAAQKSVMEFLLINHPLDCPICDQGGECELQDLAMGYGRDVSRYFERKRVVKDKDLGPLVSTDMTRCIHCTRCVRFGEEIAGIQELGTIGRGDRMQISTYIEKSISHELSGNIIDLCPVGALNNKPYRFSARAWEMIQRPAVSPHDCFGSNLNVHVMNGRVMRVVPRENESINETWLADRDRFGCEGIYAPDRLEVPMIKKSGEWFEATWEEALETAANGLRNKQGSLGALLSPGSTTEEGYLLAKLVRHLGSDSIDHRLRRRDFRQQDNVPVFFWSGADLAEIDSLESIFVIGSDLRSEVPMMAHRVRKAAVGGAQVSFLNPQAGDCLFSMHAQLIDSDLTTELARIVQAVAGSSELSAGVVPLLEGIDPPTDEHASVAASLHKGKPGLILLGQISMRHPRFAELRLLAGELARLTGAGLGYLPEGANAAGLSLAGALPHKTVGGNLLKKAGATAAGMIAGSTDGLILFGVEPEYDCSAGASANDAVASADFVLACSPFFGDSLRQCADVVLPIGTFAETSGTYVNVAGQRQSFAGVAKSVGESRPGWKVLRVLGNLLELPGCDYDTSEQIRDEVFDSVGGIQPDNTVNLSVAVEPGVPASADTENLDVSMYQVDALVRRALPLQAVARSVAAPSEPRRIASA